MSKIRLHGSSSGYTEIAPVAASGNNTLTLPNDGTIISKDANGAVGVTSVVTTTATITTAKVGAAVTISESGIEASGIGITCANIHGTQIGGRRNLIINGAMNLAQRGTAAVASIGYQSVDRMQLDAGSGIDETPSQEQGTVASGTTPYTEGFRKTLKITNGNQTTSVASNTDLYFQVLHKFESQDIASSGWDYTNPNSFITLSFWVKSSVAQEFYARLQTSDGTSYNYPFSTGSLSANTWTKVVKKIPGNSNLQFDNDVNQGLAIEWVMYRGTGKTGSYATLNTWKVYDASQRVPDMASTYYETNDATYELTGVQFEVGSQATPFEYRSHQEELHLCKRYYQRYPEGPTADNYGCVPSAVMVCNNTTTTYYCPTLNPTMRSSPSFSTSGNFRMNGTSSVNNVAVTAIGVYHNGAATPFQYATVASGLTAGQAVALSVNNDATAYIAYSAEL